MDITKQVAIAKSINADLLGKEMTEATGIACTVRAYEPGFNAAGDVDETAARLIFVFASEPLDATVDATIAAHPVTLEGVTGTFAVLAGTTYTLKEEPIAEGESVVFDVHVHAALGTDVGFSTAFVDWYVIADRYVGGEVRVSRGSGVTEGNLPGARIVSTKTATTARISIVVQRDGTLTLIGNDISIESRGTVPA